MTRKEFVEKLFGTEILTEYSDVLNSNVINKGCAGFKCPADTWCEKCKYIDFWNKPINLPNISKTVLNMLYGKPTIKYYDTDCTQAIREAFKNGDTHYCFPMNKPTITFIDNWVEVPSALIADEVNSIGEILDDATVHGLDFKYENGKFYFKDRQVSMIKDTQDVD